MSSKKIVQPPASPDILPVRFSTLKTFGEKSPAHFAAHVEKDDTPSMERGRAVHHMIFGTRNVIAYTDGNRTGKKWEAFKADHPEPEYEILTETRYDQAKAMADALRRHPMAMRALDGVREKRIDWEYCGVPCRSTPDVLAEHWVTDLKTCREGSPRWFPVAAVRSGYHGQTSFYEEAARSKGHFKGKPDGTVKHYIVAIEAEAPHVVTVFEMTERTKEAGSRLWRGWFERLMVHLQSNHWPGYSEAVVPLDVPEDDPEFTYGGEDEPAAAIAQAG